MTKVLMVVSAADHWTLNDGTHHPTGFWAEEFVVPHQTFTEAGWHVDIATPGGPVHLALAFNPSHLEIVDPVVEGSAKARMDRRGDKEGGQVLPVSGTDDILTLTTANTVLGTDFLSRINADLANEFGNLTQRTLSMIGSGSTFLIFSLRIASSVCSSRNSVVNISDLYSIYCFVIA